MGLEKCPKCGKESLIKTPRSIINLKVNSLLFCLHLYRTKEYWKMKLKFKGFTNPNPIIPRVSAT